MINKVQLNSPAIILIDYEVNLTHNLLEQTDLTNYKIDVTISITKP